MSGTYLPVTLDLSKQGTQDVAPAGVPVESIAVLSLPPGAVLTIGEKGGQQFPVPAEGKTLGFCPPLDGGVVAIVAAGQSGGGVLVVNLDLEGSSQPPEPQFIGSARVNQAGSVNSGPMVQLFNPVGSGKLARVICSRAHTATAGRVLASITDYQLTGSGGGALTAGLLAYLDRRLAVTGPPIKCTLTGCTFDNAIPVVGPHNTGTIALARFGGQVQSADVLQPGKSVVAYLTPGLGLLLIHDQNGAGTIMDVDMVHEER